MHNRSFAARWLELVIVLTITGFVFSCSNNEPTTDSETHWEDDPSNNGANPPECRTDQDCRDLLDESSDTEFAEPFMSPEQVYCHPDHGYCTECQSDADCGSSAYCVSERNCREYPTCDTGADCGSAQVHRACLDGHCKPCDVDSDCEGDKVCFVASHAGRPAPLCVHPADVEPSCLDDTCENHCGVTPAEDGVECVAYTNSEEFSAVSADGSALPQDGQVVVLWVVGPPSAPGAYHWGDGNYSASGEAGYTVPDARPPTDALVSPDLGLAFIYLISPDVELPDGRLSSDQLQQVQDHTLGATTGHALVWKDEGASGFWWLDDFADDDLTCAAVVEPPPGDSHSGFSPIDCDDLELVVGDNLQWADWR